MTPCDGVGSRAQRGAQRNYLLKLKLVGNLSHAGDLRLQQIRSRENDKAASGCGGANRWAARDLDFFVYTILIFVYL